MSTELGDTQGDHFIVLHSRINGDYVGIDPANGKEINVPRQTLSTERYIVLSVIPIFGEE